MKADEIAKKYEALILTVLAVMMAAVVLFATVELGWLLLNHIMSPPFGLIKMGQLIDVFGMFLLVLIGIELLDTVLLYHKERVVRVEVAVIVALLAIARKVIILNYKTLTSFTLLEVGAAVLALGVAYYLLRVSRSNKQRASEQNQGPSETPA
jgi:uncharacterized membrane protein (DUF373 family)